MRALGNLVWGAGGVYWLLSSRRIQYSQGNKLCRTTSEQLGYIRGSYELGEGGRDYVYPGGGARACSSGLTVRVRPKGKEVRSSKFEEVKRAHG